MKKKLHYFIFIFILNGCVEHFFYIDIKPDADININYKKNYIEKNTLLPAINPTYTNKFLLNVLKLNNHYEKLLTQPIVIKNENYYFFQIKSLEITFKKRNITNQYPILLNLINKKEISTDGISKETIKFIFNQTIEDCNFGFNIFPIVKSDVENWYKSFDNKSDSVIFKNYDIFIKQGKEIINTHLSNSNLDIKLDSILNFYISDAALTINFMKDNFNFEINWDEKIFYSNADSSINNKFLWNFSFFDFNEKDLQINIKSLQINHKKLLFLLLMIIFIFIYKKNILFR